MLSIGEPEDGRHVHMAPGEAVELHVERSEASATSVGRSEGSMTSGYSSGYDSETAAPPTRNSSFNRLRPSAD